jgi:hypothetical protein
VGSTLEIRSTDLERRCLVVVDLLEQPSERFPTSVLQALRDLVLCDDATDQVMDPSR